MPRHALALFPPAAWGAALLVLGAACSAEPVRLYELRDAGRGTPERAAYERLETAAALANEFLETSEFARDYPAAGARFLLDQSDVLVSYPGEGVWPLRIETAGWADPRTALGDGIHPTGRGFLSARTAGGESSGDLVSDTAFLQLPPQAMAGLLLRQAATMREIRARGPLDYWLNYDLLGLDPDSGWHEDNPVNARAEAAWAAYQKWYGERAAREGAPLAEPPGR